MEDQIGPQGAALARPPAGRDLRMVVVYLVMTPIFIVLWFLTFPRDEALPCPVATVGLLADVRAPWRSDNAALAGNVVLTGAQIRQQRGQALLLCSYKAEADDSARANLATNAPLGTCSIAPDGHGFVCAPGTAFGR